MSDSEDENYVQFGAPLEPLDADNLPRKRAITAADQCVYDAEGRRRFHGAFTGGFSAGYFNGVGSRDGWTPKRFKSSRAERTVGVVQRPQDFMDEEDTGQFGIAPTAIRTTEGYQNLNKDRNDASRRRQAQNDLLFQDGPIPGAPVLGEVLRPARDTVGVLLLKKMGWRPGQGVGARVTRKEKLEIRRRNKRMKVYGCARPPGEESLFSTSTDESANDEDAEDDDDENSTVTFAPDDYEPFRRVPKDNLFGIGYTGLDRRAVLSDNCDRRALLAESFFRQEKDRKIAKHGRAFGVGAFEEEDEDIYAPDDMSRYDFTLAPESAGKKSTRTKQRVSSGTAPCLEGFIKANYILHQPEAATADSANQKASKPRKFFPPPVLPANFNPVHATSRFSPSVSSVIIGKRPISNATDRAVMLDEQSSSTLTTNQRKTVESFEGRKEERKSESKNVASWLDKLQGGQAFVTGGLLTKPSNDMIEEEEKEKETSSKLDCSNFPTVEDSAEDSRRKAARLKMFGKLTRERREWRACSIVCKRFNIQENKGDTKLESGMQKRPVKFSLLSKSIDFLSAVEGKKKDVLPAKATKTEKTEMQLVEEANNLQNQENKNVETKASPSADPSSSSQVSAPTPFEVSYEKIFGKMISGAEVGKNKSESSERKDLFKAIFLDSDSDGDGGDNSDKKNDQLNEEEDNKKRNDEKIDEEEAMKSVLIGSVVETKPSFSPPSGIFSNLDKLERPKKDKKSEELQSVTEKDCDDKSKSSLNVSSLEALPENTYGPALPTTLTNNHCEDQKVESTNRQVFKSVVIPSRSGTMAEERWVEVNRSKKSKKEKKKKKKHKESKKSKKESARRRRH